MTDINTYKDKQEMDKRKKENESLGSKSQESNRMQTIDQRPPPDDSSFKGQQFLQPEQQNLDVKSSYPSVQKSDEKFTSQSSKKPDEKFMTGQDKDKDKDKHKTGTKPADLSSRKPKDLPAQEQKQHPGSEHVMDPEPAYMAPRYKGTGKLQDKVAIITGGDSGIGRSVSILYGREGAKVAIFYYHEDKDANLTQSIVEKEGSECILIRGDISDPKFCYDAVKKVADKWGKIDILVNNAAQQFKQVNLEDISDEQLERTFKVNIFSMFYLTKACLKFMKKGSSIINTTSVTSYKGNEKLLDYSTTKGAINAFTYSLSQQLADRGIRVNAVAPGPIWTPLIPSSFSAEEVKEFGKDVPLGRPGQPEEVSPSYVFLASDIDSSYFTGQILHPNGGSVIHG